MSVAFDTLAYAKDLEGLGFPTKQAEGMSELQAGIVENNLATKSDLKELSGTVQRLADTIEKRFSTKQDAAELETRLTIRLGMMLAAAVGILGVLIQLK